jgi:thiamine transport system substrate-binding protein
LKWEKKIMLGLKSILISLVTLALSGALLAGKPQSAPADRKAASKPCVLQVYTYQGFISTWGPGEEIKKTFEKTNACTVRWVLSEDAMSLYSRLRLEGAKLEADVVVGLDSLLAPEIKKAELLQAYRPQSISKLDKVAQLGPDATLIPYSLGYFAVMYDNRAIKPYASWEALLADPGAHKKLILEDPRTSSVGFGLMVWLHQIYGDRYAEAVKKLQDKTLTISKGWSEAYGLFLKGEAPMVLSYTLSEAYHRAELKDKSPYRYMEFKEGHLVQVETMGILKSSKNLEMARNFIDHMLSGESQKIIANKGSVYPVNAEAEISAVAKTVKIPELILTPQTDIFPSDFRTQWTRQWIDLVTTK